MGDHGAGVVPGLIVDGLAAYRLTRLVVEDRIFDGPRARLLGWLDPPAERFSNGVGQIVATFGDDPPFPGSRTVAEGLECSWCVGVWAGFAVRLTPKVIRRALATAAVAGIAAEAVRRLEADAD